LYIKNYCAVWFIPILLLASCSHRTVCATQRIYVRGSEKIKILSVSGASLFNISHKKKKKLHKPLYEVSRTNNPITVAVQVDSTEKTILLKPRRVYGWMFNWNCLCGISKPLTPYTSKCYRFNKLNYVVSDDTAIRIYTYVPEKKGLAYPTLSTSFPIFNLKTDKGRYFSGGVFGAEFGADYFYQKNKFLSMTFGAATDVLPVEYLGIGYREIGSILYTGVRDNFVLGKFDVGYGISFSRLFYTKQYYGDTTRADTSIRTTGLGLSFSAYYRLTSNLRIGILYQPNFFNLNHSPGLSYQHYIGIQCVWRMPGNRTRY